MLSFYFGAILDTSRPVPHTPISHAETSAFRPVLGKVAVGKRTLRDRNADIEGAESSDWAAFGLGRPTACRGEVPLLISDIQAATSKRRPPKTDDLALGDLALGDGGRLGPTLSCGRLRDGLKHVLKVLGNVDGPRYSHRARYFPLAASIEPAYAPVSRKNLMVGSLVVDGSGYSLDDAGGHFYDSAVVRVRGFAGVTWVSLDRLPS